MFSPSTTAAIAAIVNCHNSSRRTSPRLQGAALSHGGASSQCLPSGETTESRRGGNNTNAAPTPAPPARRLPFASVGWETPLTGTYSIFLPSPNPLNHQAGALLLLLLSRRRRGKRGRRMLLRGRGVLFTTLMMVVIDMMMTTISSHPLTVP